MTLHPTHHQKGTATSDPMSVGVECRLGCAAAGHREVEEIRSRTGLADVFSPTERAHSGRHRSLDGYAGRLAAKYAIADALALPVDDRDLLKDIEIVPAPRNDCANPAHCEQGHPPTVLFGRSPDIAGGGRLLWIDVSITHEAGQAFATALALVLRFPPERAFQEPSPRECAFQEPIFPAAAG